jgi:hypothetical protein
MENTDKTQEKEFTPFQLLIKVIDEHVEFSQEQEITNYQLGYITGLMKTRNSCSQLLTAEKLEIKEIFEAGKNNKEVSFNDWFNEKYHPTNSEQKRVQIDLEENKEEPNVLKDFYGERLSMLFPLLNKRTRILLYCLFIFFHFLFYMGYTVLLILTFRFTRLQFLPRNAERSKRNFKEFIGF